MEHSDTQQYDIVAMWKNIHRAFSGAQVQKPAPLNYGAASRIEKAGAGVRGGVLWI